MSFPDLELLPTKEDIVKKDMEIERLENKVNQMRDAIETALSYQGESMEEWLYEKLKFCLEGKRAKKKVEKMPDTQKNLELAPCPFCGGEAAIEYCEIGCCGGKPRWVVCDGCGAMQDAPKAFSTVKETIDNWNTRHNEQG